MPQRQKQRSLKQIQPSSESDEISNIVSSDPTINFNQSNKTVMKLDFSVRNGMSDA
jgi:hypothetical protein